MNKTLVNSGIVLATTLGIGVLSQPANAFSFSFGPNSPEVNGTPIIVSGTVDNVLVGSKKGIKITVGVDPSSPSTGDLRGFFFDVKESFETLVGGFIITVNNGVPISSLTQIVDGVNSAGSPSNNLSPENGFDVGFEIGNSGIGGGDDFQTLIFTLTHGTEDIGGYIFGQDERFGIRLTSVGPGLDEDDREGSSKVVGKVPTPALLPGLVGLGIAALRKKQEDMAEEA